MKRFILTLSLGLACSPAFGAETVLSTDQKGSRPVVPARLTCEAAAVLVSYAGGLAAAKARAKYMGYTETEMAALQRRCPDLK